MTVGASAARLTPRDVFVGRGKLIERLVAAFRTGRVALGDAWGIPGSGKTTLLDHVPAEVSAQAVAIDFRFDAAAFDQPTANASVVAYDAFRAFVGAAAERLKRELDPPEDSREARLFLEFDEAYDKTKVERGRVSNKVIMILSKVEDSSVGDVKLSDQMLDAQRAVLSAAFATLLNKLGQERDGRQGRRFLLTLHSADVLGREPLRAWVLDLVKELDSALVMTTRMPNVAPPEVTGVSYIGCELTGLSLADIAEVAHACLSPEAVSEELVSVIERETHGHPQSVGLAIELLQRLDPADRDPVAFERHYRSLPSDLAQRHAAMVARILGRDAANAASLLEACAVLRTFDAEALGAVLDDGDATTAFSQLRGYSFVEPASTSASGSLRLHPVVRDAVERRLAADDSDRHRLLHTRAAAFRAAWISRYEEEEVDPVQGSYGAWYRYERPAWQAAKREWLYHQARAGSSEEERRRGRLHFARVFLDAFWWWGCYLEFPYCDDLIDDWRATQDDGEWTEALETLLRAYPPGYEKAEANLDWRPGALQRWDAVRAALLAVQESCGLSAGAGELRDPEERHTRGLIDNFLAHAARYRPYRDDASRAAGYEAARALYDEAVGLFRANDDRWDLAWTLFERAELRLEQGDADGARSDWAEAAELVPKLEDEELAANLHRLAADAHAAAGDFESAFAAHRRAVLHAYLFQKRPHEPDAYTLSFYAEQVVRALEQLTEYARSRGDVVRAAQLLRLELPAEEPADVDVAEAVDAAVESDSFDELRALARALFPAAPELDELGVRNSLFVQRWLLAEDEIGLDAPTDVRESEW